MTSKEPSLADWAHEAFKCINRGVELVTRDQLSQWEGVRAVIEFFPGGEHKAICSKQYGDPANCHICSPTWKAQKDTALEQAKAYVEVQDYINDENRRAAGNGYMAGWRDRGETAPADNSLVKQMWEADQKVYRAQEIQLKETRRLLDWIAAACGTPDAAEGCRNILKRIRELKETTSPTAQTSSAEQEGCPRCGLLRTHTAACPGYSETAPAACQHCSCSCVDCAKCGEQSPTDFHTNSGKCISGDHTWCTRPDSKQTK